MILKTIKNYYFYLAIFIIGIILRFYYSSLESYWIDEQIAFYVSDPTLSFKESVLRSYSSDYSPFLFNFFLKICFILFSYSPDIGRYFSIFSGILSIIFLLLISFMILKKKSLFLTLFLSSFNIFLIAYSSETRAYSTIFLLSLINIYFFFKVFISKKSNKSFVFLFSFFSLLMLLSHPFTILILISELSFLFINDLKNKKIKYFKYLSFLPVLIFYLVLEQNYIRLIFSYNPPEFFIKNPDIDFFISFYFNRFFGSKIMGFIFLFTFIFLIAKNKKKIINNKFYLFLFILFALTYLIPVIYGYLFNPVLKDRYIIFVLVPIILLVSNLIYELKDLKIKKFLIGLIVISTITNQFFELYNKNIDKPDFNKMIEKLNNQKIKNISVITLDKVHVHMMDIQKKDPFRERDIIKNYIKYFDGLDKSFLFFNQEKIPPDLKNLWLICYEPIVANKCKENIKIDKSFKIKETIHLYQLTSFLLKK